jgi:hypothetical protein
MQAAAAQNLSSATPRFRNILVVIKQTAFEEYTQVSERTVRPTHAPQPAVMIDASRGVGHFKRQGDGLQSIFLTDDRLIHSCSCISSPLDNIDDNID